MKFIVTRTSVPDYDNPNKKTCDEAKFQEIIRINPEGYKTTLKRWIVEFNSLEDLIRFVKKYGDVIIVAFECEDRYMLKNGEAVECEQIEIYDDYK